MTDAVIRPIVNPVEEVKGRSLWADAWQRLRRNRAAVVSLVLLGIIAVVCVVTPMVSPIAIDDVFWDSVSSPPDFAGGHYFGTDDNGRDLFVRTSMAAASR
jgi:oligopeptide transport system permease protein